METNERKVSTRVQGAAWRRRDAPKARGVSFLERHGGVEEKREGHKGIPAGEEEDERVSVESLGKPEAYFFFVYS